MYLKHSLLGTSALAFMAADGGRGTADPVSPLEKALKTLDPGADDHWTAGDLPRLEHLEHATSQDVSRADVDAITEGTKRDAWADWAKDKWPDAGADAGDIDDGEGEGNADEGEREPADPVPPADPDAADADAGDGKPVEAARDPKVADDMARAQAQRDNGVQTPAAKVAVPGEVKPFLMPRLGEDIVVKYPHDQHIDGSNEAAGKVVRVLDGPGGVVNARVYAPNGGADQTITGLRHVSKFDELAADSPERNLAAWDYPSAE